MKAINNEYHSGLDSDRYERTIDQMSHFVNQLTDLLIDPAFSSAYRFALVSFCQEVANQMNSEAQARYDNYLVNNCGYMIHMLEKIRK